jgi:hypothetical protein
MGKAAEAGLWKSVVRKQATLVVVVMMMLMMLLVLVLLVLCCVVLCCVAYKSTAEDGLCIGEIDYLPYVKERVHVQYSRYGRDRIRVFYV